MDDKTSRLLEHYEKAGDRTSYILVPEWGPLCAYYDCQLQPDSDERLQQLNSSPKATAQEVRDFNAVYIEKGGEFPFNQGEVRKLQAHKQERKKWYKWLRELIEALCVRERKNESETKLACVYTTRLRQ
ncbi:hypothetical protein FOXG_22725 [Fusarium oxysporum f. sp. lycopersici 4287]|uniref:Uncharacterized protein n=1 Tax=Fusarium oxysporum f. sp. lycopersici (strain 4287 / CBS 123668 / FGSC 9935 / NRRL 34936) TaxID=426428 RepID=A0A0J9WBZ2_FUSO4|nr:hypothetical protein FOXG_22725 [Fusarium oxysporum f. sp. lycopersici 4287]EWZ77427.1 hypothetical protein FOWG_18163 [Fusarium oxysporum f. sp. lycopersici MN25]KNB20031.1 hypothetical protein FOXG_22725 [Fusarium oxysporum f. sp. lycopersici 4287]